MSNDLSPYARDALGVVLMQLDSAADDLRRLRDGAKPAPPVSSADDLPAAASVVSSDLSSPGARDSEPPGVLLTRARELLDLKAQADRERADERRVPKRALADYRDRCRTDAALFAAACLAARPGDGASPPHPASPPSGGEEHEAARRAALPAHEHHDHIIDGEFHSDKYPSCPPGKVPLSTKDPMAQDLLWQYAQRRRAVDGQFADDLERALRIKGYYPNQTTRAAALHARDLLALSRLLEAVTPTVDTLRAYRGQFIFDVRLFGELTRGAKFTAEVPTATLIEILAAIRRKAGVDSPSVILSEAKDLNHG